MATKAKTRKAKDQPKRDPYREATDLILEALDEGVVPWHQPWKSLRGGEDHHNASSGHVYRGINVWVLDVTAWKHGYSTPAWVTFKQAKALAYATWCKREGRKQDDDSSRKDYAALSIEEQGGVRKGEKSTIIVFWKPIVIKETDDAGKEQRKQIWLTRCYAVFNVEQCAGFDYTQPELPEFEPYDEAERVFDEMPNPPTFSHGGNRAFYAPGIDAIKIPRPAAFESRDAYYSTRAHETVHATGHESRTGRVKDWGSFGSDPYAKEELVAEMGAAFVCRRLGIDRTIESSAAYIDHWRGVLRADKRIIVNTAQQAKNAVLYIFGETEQREATESEAAVAA